MNKETDKDFENRLRQFLKDVKNYDTNMIFSSILKKEQNFIKTLNEQQRTEFQEIRLMYEDYVFTAQQQEFSRGFFLGISSEK